MKVLIRKISIAITAASVVFAVFSFVTTAFSQNSDVQKLVPSAITSVTVYSDRASVTRVGQTDVQAGTTFLSFANLPITLFDNSVRVSGNAVNARIRDVQTKTIFLDTIPESQVSTLQSQLDNVKAQIQEVNDRDSVLIAEKNFIFQIKPQSAAGAEKNGTVSRGNAEEWQKAISFFDANLNKIYSELRKNGKELVSLQAKAAALEKQIQAITRGSRRAVKSVVVEIEASQRGPIELAVTYVVSNAKWMPEYELHANSESHSVDVRYRAVVQQTTGEDWSNVDVTLTTARPDISGTEPELSPWYVNIFQPRPMMYKMPEKTGMLPSIATQTENAVAMPQMEEERAGVESRTTSFLFHFPSKKTIPSDNTPHSFTIHDESLTADFSYSSTPKLSPFVYLKAAVKNTSNAPFLAGKASIFFNNDFVSTTQLDQIAPGDSFTLSLGIDPSVKVERKLINKFTEYTGTFTKSVRVTYEYEFSLENRRKSDATVNVQDQLPISQNEKIVVTPLEPPISELQKNESQGELQQGIVTWNVFLKPAEKKTWKFRFSVEYPRDLSITGLD